MIPILYEVGEMSFTTEGIGRLVDCVECVVTEERNGIYECEFTYPVDGRHYSDIQEGRIIYVIHDDSRTVQPFDIYGRSAPLDGLVTFYAHHVSYRLGNVVLRPYSASNVALALSRFSIYAMTGNPFTFWTDKADAGDFSLGVPKSIREVLGGSDGSILDAFNGGEYEFDKFQVKLYASRGIDTEVEIRYGKNLTELKHDIDISGTYNAVLPYYKSGDDPAIISGSIVITNQVVPESVNLTTNTGDNITTNTGAVIELYTADFTVAPLDLSSNFDSKPTQTQLVTEAQNYMAKNKPWDPSENITVDFIALWQMPEYEQYTSLQRVRLCDTVSVIYKELGVNKVKQKVVKTVYDVLNEQYNSIELGQTEKSLAQTIQYSTQKILENVPSKSMLADAIAEATSKITGGRGGHVVFNTDGEGNPDEILIMDTASINTAVSVIRINKNGIGFSQNGYQGPFRSAWTIDGKFNADFITVGIINANLIRTGTLLANLIQTGKITSVNDKVWFDLDNDELVCSRVRGARPVVWASDWPGDVYLDMSWLQNGNHYETYARLYNTNSPSKGVTFRPPSTSQYVDSNTFKIYTTSSDLELICNANQSGGESNSSAYLLLSSNLARISDGTCALDCQNGKSYARYGDFHCDSNTGYFQKLEVTSTKHRRVETEDYGERLLCCYETPSPEFGDIGEGVIGNDGMCYVWIDPIFAETVTLTQYQVFLQKYGDGDCYVDSRTNAFFSVKGTPNLKFGWEIKAKQCGFEQMRLEKKFYTEDVNIGNGSDFGTLASNYYATLMGGRTL